MEYKEKPDDGDEINDNPIEEVRLTVPITDDSTLPVLTFRTWLLGPITCIFLAFITQFLSFRQNPVNIDSSCFPILTLVTGKLMAAILPTKPIKIPITNWSFSMNPGPFNIKEHVVLNILVGSGLHNSFPLVIVTVTKAFYHKHISFWASFVLIQTTQMVGYGFAGIFMKFLVSSPHMWWPTSLLDVSLYRLLHEVNIPRAKRQLQGLQFFMIVAVSSFAYHIIPNYFFPSISTLSFVCWFWKDSVTAHQIGSGLHGLGIGSFSLDWNVITGFLPNPLAIPMFSVVNTMVGFLLVAYVVVPISYWTNLYSAKRFPFFSSDLFDANGQIYNVSQIVNEDLILNQQAYDNYSSIYMSVYLIYSFGFRFASETSYVTYFILYHARESWFIFKQALKGRDQFNDVHNRLMKSYKPIPNWWFYVIVVPMIALALINSIYLGTDFQLPYWGVLLGYFLPFVLTLPAGVITATTGQGGVDLYGLSELIMGSIYPGYPIANLAFKSYCFCTLSNTMTIIPELKTGHYMKIPPRSLFIAQIVGSFISYSTSLSTMWWLLARVDNICDQKKLPTGSPWTCPSEHRMFSISMIWGGVGPAHVFAPHGQYSNIYYFFLVGVVATVLAWLLGGMFHEKSWIRLINFPLIFSAVQGSPPAAAIHFWSWFVVAFVFNLIVYRKYKEWWAKYNYDLGNGLSVGAAFVALLTSFTLGMGGVYGMNWWGLDWDDHCPLATCPTAPGVKVDGCPVER